MDTLEGSGALYNVTNSSTMLTGIVLGRIVTAFLILFFVIGLPWNILVIAVIPKKMLFTKPSGMLLLNLAIANFLVCLLMMPFWAVVGLIPGETPEELLTLDKVCQAAVLQILLTTATIYTVALMAIDRAIYLAKPLSYDSIVTPWRIFIAIMITWLSCTAISLPLLFGFGQYRYSTSLISCIPDDSEYTAYYYIILVIFAAMGTLTQLFGCGYIIYVTRKALGRRLLRIVGSQRSNEAFKNYTASQIQLVKVFGAIFSVSLITLLPLIAAAVSLLILGPEEPVIQPYFNTIVLLSVLSKSVVHPILESYMHPETRSVISKRFAKWQTSMTNTKAK